MIIFMSSVKCNFINDSVVMASHGTRVKCCYAMERTANDDNLKVTVLFL